MRYYKDGEGGVYSFETEEQKEEFKPELVPITEAERDQLLAPTAAQLTETRQAEILARLKEIDIESIRPLRSKGRGNSSSLDDTKLNDLDTEAESLRTELQGLLNG